MKIEKVRFNGADLPVVDKLARESIETIKTTVDKMGGFEPIIDEETGRITGYKTNIGGADAVFPFNTLDNIDGITNLRTVLVATNVQPPFTEPYSCTEGGYYLCSGYYSTGFQFLAKRDDEPIAPIREQSSTSEQYNSALFYLEPGDTISLSHGSPGTGVVGYFTISIFDFPASGNQTPNDPTIGLTGLDFFAVEDSKNLKTLKYDADVCILYTYSVGSSKSYVATLTRDDQVLQPDTIYYVGPYNGNYSGFYMWKNVKEGDVVTKIGSEGYVYYINGEFTSSDTGCNILGALTANICPSNSPVGTINYTAIEDCLVVGTYYFASGGTTDCISVNGTAIEANTDDGRTFNFVAQLSKSQTISNTKATGASSFVVIKHEVIQSYEAIRSEIVGSMFGASLGLNTNDTWSSIVDSIKQYEPNQLPKMIFSFVQTYDPSGKLLIDISALPGYRYLTIDDMIMEATFSYSQWAGSGSPYGESFYEYSYDETTGIITVSISSGVPYTITAAGGSYMRVAVKPTIIKTILPTFVSASTITLDLTEVPEYELLDIDHIVIQHEWWLNSGGGKAGTAISAPNLCTRTYNATTGQLTLSYTYNVFSAATKTVKVGIIK